MEYIWSLDLMVDKFTPHRGNTRLTTSIIWGFESFPSGNPTLKLLQSSTISRSVSWCWKMMEENGMWFYNLMMQTFLLVSLLTGSSLISFCFFGFFWTTAFSSGLMLTESIKFFRFSGISSAGLYCCLVLFFFFVCPISKKLLTRLFFHGFFSTYALDVKLSTKSRYHHN